MSRSFARPLTMVRNVALCAALATAVVAQPARASVPQPCLSSGSGTYHFLIALPNKDKRDAMLVLEEERGCLVGTLIIDGEHAVRVSLTSINEWTVKASVPTAKGVAELTAELKGDTPRGELVIPRP